jgi:DeoR family fructose operon transcriptional repressor
VLPEERRRKILDLVKERGFIALGELSSTLNASESTLRRDLDYWDQQGQLKRTHGGARFAGASGDGNASPLPALEDRATTAVEEKRQIARMTAERITDGSSVLLDAGTTTLALARLLIGRPIQVVTNSLPIAILLSQSREPDVILLGGFVYPRTGVALGPITIDQLKEIHVRQAIMSCHGITPQGLFNHNLLLVETQRAMMESAEETVILADHTKLGRPALTLLCPLGDVDTLVVDSGLSVDATTWITETGVNLVVSTEGRISP